jgi:DNA-binding transcriptional LysR family regulator
MDRLQAIEIFVKVAELKSFTAAATALSLSRTLVSERVRDLEEDLGVRLLQRTTRRVALTEPGAAFLERVRLGLAAFEEAAAEASSLSARPRGVLRVNAPMSFGFRHLAPSVGAFMQLFPDVRVELTLTDRLVNLIEDNVDVAIRIGDLSDSSLIARKLATCRMILCASPAYIKRSGAPRHPREITDHVCLFYTYWLDGDEWRFTRRSEEIVVHAGQAALRSNNGDAIAAAAAEGAGIALQPSFIAGPLIKQGRLIELLPAWKAAEFGVYAVHPQTQFVPAKSRAFMDYLAKAYKRPPWS